MWDESVLGNVRMWLLSRWVFGTNDPAPDWLKRLACLHKGKPESWKLWMIDGYLMLRFLFKDGTSVDLRESPVKWRDILHKEDNDEAA